MIHTENSWSAKEYKSQWVYAYVYPRRPSRQPTYLHDATESDEAVQDGAEEWPGGSAGHETSTKNSSPTRRHYSSLPSTVRANLLQTARK